MNPDASHDLKHLHSQKNCKSKIVKLVYAGSLRKEKGLNILLKLSKSIARFGSKVELHIYGGSFYYSLWLRVCMHLTFRFNTYIHGYIDHKDIKSKLTSYDVGLLPYEYAKKPVMDFQSTSPIKLFEYMSAGLAIICTDLPEVSSVIKSARNGIICSFGNNQEFIESTLKLIENNSAILAFKTQSLLNSRHYTYENRVLKIMTSIKDERSWREFPVK